VTDRAAAARFDVDRKQLSQAVRLALLFIPMHNPKTMRYQGTWLEVADGKLTEKGLKELKDRMPYADITEFAKNPEVDRIGDLYTVEMLVKYVADKLAAAGK